MINLPTGGRIDFSNKSIVLSGTVPPGAALAQDVVLLREIRDALKR